MQEPRLSAGLAHLRKLDRRWFLRLGNARANDSGTVKVLLIGLAHAFKTSFPRSRQGIQATRPSHRREEVRLCKHEIWERDELLEVVGDISGLTMLHVIFWSTDRTDYSRNARCERLQNHKTEGISFRREHEKIHIGECTR